MFKVFPDISLKSIASCVPEDERPNLRLFEKFGEEHMQRLIQSTGVHKTRWTKYTETAADLCFQAAKKLLQVEDIDASSIDALVFSCISPDELAPPTSHRLQFRLGLRKDIFCVDLTFGCSGYIMGISQACLLIHSGIANRVLLLTGETPTKSLNPEDRSTLPLFGDGGSATIIEKDPGRQISISTFADGSGAEAIICDLSGYRRGAGNDPYLRMSGTDVFIFATREVPQSIDDHLKAIGTPIENINFYCLHQANILIINTIAKKLKMSPERVLNSISDFGNTGSASIPISLCFNHKKIENTQGTKTALLSGFGVGLSWGSVVCDLTQTHIHPILISQ